MTEYTCRFFGGRGDVFVAYLYDDIEADERAAFDAHLATCSICRQELAALRDVRGDLAEWSPPAMAAADRPSLNWSPASPAPSLQPPASRWRDIPVWAQVAAASLFLGASAGMANLNVHYGPAGLSVTTGWSKPAANVQPAAATAATPWRADLAALGDELRREFREQPTVTPQAAAARSTAAADADLTRRVRAMVDESEHRQQRELALRVADVLRDVEAERRADLVKIDRTLGVLQNNTGVEVMRNRQMLDYLVRVSQNK